MNDVRMNRARRLGLILTGMALAGLAFAPAAHAAVAETPDRTTGTNGRVYAILQVGSRVYVGGSFSAALVPGAGSVARRNLLALDATTGALDAGFRPEPGGEIQALATDGTKLFVGGAFSTVGGLQRRNLAAVDLATGAAVPGWKADANGKVFALAAGTGTNPRLYAGGSFTALTDTAGARARYNLGAVGKATGAVDGAWDAAVAGEDPVRSMALSADGNRLYFGGEFSAVRGQNRSHIAAVNAATAALDTGFFPRSLPTVFDITTDGIRVYVALGGSGGEVQALDPVTGATRWRVHGNGNFQSVALRGGLLYVAGHYGGANAFGGLVRFKLAAVNPATGAIDPFDPRIDSALGVFEIESGSTGLLIGGDFTVVSGVSQPHFARLAG